MIGKRLRLLREKEGISQERLGEILGVVRSQISMYESDERDPSPEVLLKIHKHYNCSIDYLFGLKDEIYIGSQKPVPIEEAMTLLTKEE